MRKSAAALLLESRIGERFDAIVTGASAKGTWVRIIAAGRRGKGRARIRGPRCRRSRSRRAASTPTSSAASSISRACRCSMKPPETNHRPLAYKDEDVSRQRRRPPAAHPRGVPRAAARAFAASDIRDTIVFFGSARLAPDGPLGRYYAEARELARLVTEWSKSLPSHAHRYIVCSGGGGGIMEAANRGASEAGRKDHRPQHRLAARAAAQPLHHPRARPSSSTTSSCASCGSRTWRARWWSSPAASARWTS